MPPTHDRFMRQKDRRQFRLAAALAVMFIPLAAGAGGAWAEAKRDARTEVELIAQDTSARPGSETLVALWFKPDPDWHLYWRNPGDSGMAPDIRWELPEGVTAGEVRWPYPRLIPLEPLASYGYEEAFALVVPMKIGPEAEGNVTLKARVEWLACKVDCIPGEAELELTLPVRDDAPRPDPRRAEIFARAQAEWPAPPGDLKIEFSLSAGGLILRMENVSGAGFVSAHFFPLDGTLIRHEAAQTLRHTARGYELVIPLSADHRASTDRVAGVLVLDEGAGDPGARRAVLVDAPVVPSAAAHEGGPGLAAALALAFIGGVLLNLMPCVLPVLSLKVLHFVREASENPRTLLAHGLVFTAGTVVSFWTLAGTLLAIRSAGVQIGWGFQLQSPAFVAALAILFTLFAVNLFGAFEVGTSLGGAGQTLIRRGGLRGSFFGGVFATVVATPCTAPFMGAALGFTLTQPAWTSMAVFTSLALGMASPYLLLCAKPGLLRRVPKPGAWMVTLKQFLGFPLAATALWLTWVFGAQKGLDAMTVLLVGLLLASMGGWCWGRGTRFARAAAVIALSAAAALAVSAAGSDTSGPPTPASDAAPRAGKIAWEPYSDERLEQLRSQGRPVFIDFTAAWCLTCKVNERLALDLPGVAAEFERLGVAALKGDWTSRDARITEALARYGRNSVPLYVHYAAGSEHPEILPEILTPGTVIDALRNSPRATNAERIRSSE